MRLSHFLILFVFIGSSAAAMTVKVTAKGSGLSDGSGRFLEFIYTAGDQDLLFSDAHIQIWGRAKGGSVTTRTLDLSPVLPLTEDDKGKTIPLPGWSATRTRKSVADYKKNGPGETRLTKGTPISFAVVAFEQRGSGPKLDPLGTSGTHQSVSASVWLTTQLSSGSKEIAGTRRVFLFTADGKVAPIPVPAAGALLLGTILLVGAWRRARLRSG